MVHLLPVLGVHLCQVGEAVGEGELRGFKEEWHFVDVADGDEGQSGGQDGMLHLQGGGTVHAFSSLTYRH